MSQEYSADSTKRVIFLLTISDIFTWGVYYSITTIVGIYLAAKLGANAIEFIGIGTGIYMLTRALLQVPIGIYNDKTTSDNDEIITLVVSSILMGLPFVLYPLIANQWTYFFLQFVFGVGTALNLVSWRKLFAQNLDRNHEGRQYALYELIMSLTTSVMGIVAGVVSNQSPETFEKVIVIVGLIMMTAFIWPLMITAIKTRRSKID